MSAELTCIQGHIVSRNVSVKGIAPMIETGQSNYCLLKLDYNHRFSEFIMHHEDVPFTLCCIDEFLNESTFVLNQYENMSS